MKPFRAISLVLIAGIFGIPSHAQSITLDLSTTSTAGTNYIVNFTEVTGGKLNTAYGSTANVVITGDPNAIYPPTVKFSGGKATAQITFLTIGKVTVTITDQLAAAVTGQAITAVAANPGPTLASCASCFASFGAGAVLTSTKWGDYTNSSNILQATHIGASTPQYVAGVSYKLAIRGIGYNKLQCTTTDFLTKRSDAKIAFCYPFKAFINLKFSPDSSQTFNGFTYGASHALHQYLDIMIGISYSANNEISPGFQQAALSIVKAQQAANNPYYSQFNLASLQADGPTAYDGFPTQLLNANGTIGALIYTGSPTVLHYHTGFFVGVAIPVGFKSAF